MKKINRLIPTDENKILIFSTQIIDTIDNCIKNLYRLSKALHGICTEALTSTTFLSETNDGIPSKTLEELAYQVCDKIYLNDDSGPYENLR